MLADRLDGKAAQAVVGDSDYDPLRIDDGRIEATNAELAEVIHQIIIEAKYEREAQQLAGGEAPSNSGQDDQLAELLKSVTADGDPVES
jgi:hypothetical protein